MLTWISYSENDFFHFLSIAWPTVSPPNFFLPRVSITLGKFINYIKQKQTNKSRTSPFWLTEIKMGKYCCMWLIGQLIVFSLKNRRQFVAPTELSATVSKIRRRRSVQHSGPKKGDATSGLYYCQPMWNDDSKVNTTLINIVGFIRTGGKRKINKSSMKREFFLKIGKIPTFWPRV